MQTSNNPEVDSSADQDPEPIVGELEALMRQIEGEIVPDRLTELAQQLQQAISDRDAMRGHEADAFPAPADGRVVELK